MDPITAAIVTALASGAAFVGNTIGGEAVKDAYAALKNWIVNRHPKASVDPVEAQPDSKARQAVLGEDLDRDGASKDPELVKLAQALTELLQKENSEAARSIGVDLGALNDATVTFQNVNAGKNATGVKIGDVTGGTLSFGDITASSGDAPAKTP